jgi:hypothetical protein
MLMSNPLFRAFGGNQQPNMIGDFQRFMQQMQGKNPQQEIANLLQSGRISQQQLNQAQQMAQQMQGMMGMLKR